MLQSQSIGDFLLDAASMIEDDAVVEFEKRVELANPRARSPEGTECCSQGREPNG